jgi:hypothetical protein
MFDTGKSFSDFKEHTTIFKGTIMLKIDVGYFIYLGTCDFYIKKLSYPRDSNRLSGVIHNRGVNY